MGPTESGSEGGTNPDTPEPPRGDVDREADAAEPSTTDLRHRAARGLVSVALRTVFVRAIGFLGVVVIAPLLGPSDYGIVALGLTITIVGYFFADGGLNPGLIGREEPPSKAELQAVAGFQLLVTGTITAIVCAIGLPQGTGGAAIALMSIALMPGTLRVPGVIMAERQLHYSVIVRAEVTEAMIYSCAAVGLVLLGFGVIGVGVAAILRSVVGTTIIVAFGDVGLVRPRLNLRLLLPTMRFGVFFQGAWLATILRDQGLNVLLASIAGTAALGAWSLANRLLVVLTLLFESAWRVALPGFARLTEAGESPSHLLERGLSFAATSTGFAVAGMVAATPAAVPALFGGDWDATISALPWIAGGSMIALPLVTVLATLLWVRGDSERVFYMAAPAIVVTLALGAILSAPLGAVGAGIAYFAGQALLLCTCIYQARELFGWAAAGHIVVPTLSAAAAATVGWLVAITLTPQWIAAIAAAIAAIGIYAALVAVFDHAAMARVLNVLRQSLRPAAT